MKKISIQVTLTGIRPIMFDRFPGSLSTSDVLAPMDKLYTDKENNLVFPAMNLVSFLSSQGSESAPQRVMGRGWKAIAKAALSFVNIDPILIPFTRDGEKISKDDPAIFIHYAAARVRKATLFIPSPKERPVLELPWELNFNLELFENKDLSEVILKRLFDEGGISIGIGTYRGVFGKFVVTRWDKIK